MVHFRNVSNFFTSWEIRWLAGGQAEFLFLFLVVSVAWLVAISLAILQQSFVTTHRPENCELTNELLSSRNDQLNAFYHKLLNFIRALRLEYKFTGTKRFVMIEIIRDSYDLNIAR